MYFEYSRDCFTLYNSPARRHVRKRGRGGREHVPGGRRLRSLPRHPCELHRVRRQRLRSDHSELSSLGFYHRRNRMVNMSLLQNLLPM